MNRTRTCRECGVPLGISRTMSWNPDGTITQKGDPLHRMIFFESENLDRMWARLSDELGVTMEHLWEMVIASKSRATRAFLYRTLPWYLNLAARVIGYRTLMSTIEAQGLVMGYGKITLGGQYPRRGRPQRVTVFIEDPYSLPLFCGDFKGSAEVLERRQATLTYQALDERRHQIDVTVREEKLERELFQVEDREARVPGDIVYDPCPSCGAPRELSQFQWDLNTGVIRDTVTGRRLAFFGTAGLKAIFAELEHELGERVFSVIVDSERENTIAAMKPEEARGGFNFLRRIGALRGLGLLTSLELTETTMRASMVNPSIPQYLLGLALGVYELATGKRGTYTWRMEPGGEISVEITPEGGGA